MKAIPVAVLVIVMGLALPVPILAQAQAGNTSLGVAISQTIQGLSLALQKVSKTSPAYRELNASLYYLKQAQSFYEKGNYSEAELYFALAMNSSFNGLKEEGKPFSVPPGLNVSRAVALKYADKLKILAENVQNETLREELINQIDQAVYLLTQQATNATQAAHNLALARQILGNASAKIHKYSKAYFGKQMALYVMHRGRFKDLKFMNAMEVIFQNMSFSYIANISSILTSSNYTVEVIQGTIGTYGNLVYFNSSIALPFVTINNVTFVPFYVPPKLLHANRGLGHRQGGSYKIEIIGVLNSSYVYNYVMSKKGSNITFEILPCLWTPSSIKALKSGAEELNISLSQIGFQVLKSRSLGAKGRCYIIIVILYDVGSYQMKPTGLQIYYEQI